MRHPEAVPPQEDEDDEYPDGIPTFTIITKKIGEERCLLSDPLHACDYAHTMTDGNGMSIPFCGKAVAKFAAKIDVSRAKSSRGDRECNYCSGPPNFKTIGH